MKRFKARQTCLLPIFILSVFFITGCGGGGETGHWAPTQLASIEVTPPNQSIAKGTTQQFMATGIYSNNTKQDLTTSVTWTSSNVAVATISNAAGLNGLATGLTIGGPITITATDPATGRTGTVTLTVTAATLTSLGVTPVTRSIALGTTQPFIATGVYTDFTTQDLTSSVTWTSSDTAVATISNTAGSNGVATSKAVGGPITITAADPATGRAGTATLTVTAATLSSIGVTPVTRSIALGTTQPFIATGLYSDFTTQDLTLSVTWSSSNAAVATISNAVGSNGVATSKAIGGPITITATDPATGRAGTATLTVTAATLSSIGVTPVTASIALGTKQQFIATGTYSDFTTQDLTSSVTWSSSNAAIATISNAAGSNGLATSLAVGGPITITATDPATAKAGTATLTVTAATLSSIGVTPVAASIALGTTQQFIATGTYSDLTTRILTSAVTWTSSNLAVATISNAVGFNGLATSLAVGGPITITATDPATGKAGTATLTVTAATLSSIGVTPVAASIALGTTQQFIATGTYSDLTTKILTSSVTWTSSNVAVATISNAAGFNGLATPLAVGGPITITATDPATGRAGTATLTVTAATLSSIGVTPVTASIALGTTQQFIATGVYSDLTTKILTSSVTWTSSNVAVATISNAAGFNGLATPLAVGGPITITATDPATGRAGTATLTVTAATLSSIGVTPVTASIALGTTQQFIATGVYSDLTTKILTSSVTWTSSNAAVATISNASGFNGLATPLAVGGPITITATDPATGRAGTATLAVTAATLSSIGVTPVIASIALGTTQQFIATGVYSDLTTKILTSSVTWTSSNAAVATISNASGFNGLATPLAVGGPITITATDPATGRAGTATLTVTAATLVSIGVTPVNASIALAATQQFIATARYSDATTRDLTSSVTWTSSNAAVATISNAPGFNGLATPLTVGGPITITATDPLTLIAGTARLTVTASALVSIAVTPVNPSIALTTTQQFVATGTYADATTQILTTSVTWTSSNLAAATIDNAPGFQGLATAIAAGITTITATDPVTLIAGTTTLTVTGVTLSSIAVTPANPGIAVGETQQFVATGTYSDATTQILTSSVTWTSSNTAVATISNAPGFQGLATAIAVGGPITITATDPATLIVGTAQLTVTIAPNLGAAKAFGGFGGGAGMTNQGILTVINGGDIGTTAVSTTVTGFHDSTGDGYTETPLNIGDVKGRIYTAPPPPVIFAPGGPFGGTAETMVIATAAAADALKAFNYLAGLPGGADPGAGQLGGLTLAPGTYTAAGGTFLLTGSDLTLNGTANDIWVFQMAASLTIGAPGFPRNIILAGGAQAKNVFWQVGSAARIENRCSMVGTIIASTGVTISTAGELQTTTLDGRALGLNASVTMVNTIVNVPAQ